MIHVFRKSLACFLHVSVGFCLIVIALIYLFRLHFLFFLHV